MHKKLPLLLIAFLEGFCVILIELASGRIVAPIFGTGLQVWSGVLGITLFGLASGYFLGSRLNFVKNSIILFLIGSAAAYVALFTFFSGNILLSLSSLNYEVGLIFSLIITLFVPLTLLGAVGPFLSDRLALLNGKAGKATGIIFSVSTFGGIGGAFVTGFLLIPQVGITKTLYIASFLLGLIVLFIVGIQNTSRKGLKAAAISCVLVFTFLQINVSARKTDRPLNQVLRYENENMLSQLRVIDVPTQQKNGDNVTFRMMMVNNTLQAIVDANNPSIDHLQFGRITEPLIDNYFQGKRVLVLGLGGGIIANQFVNGNCKVDVVEIDPRVGKLAYQYFGLSDAVNVIIQDARRYIETSQQKYDVIFIDTFHGESIPSHIFTQEALGKMKLLLTNNGVLISNFHGFTDSERGVATSAVFKTLSHVGFKSKILVTNTDDSEMRSLLFLSSLKGFDDYKAMKNLSVSNLTYKSGYEGKLSKFMVDPSILSISTAPLLTDDKQQLDFLLREVSLEWRQYCYEKFVKMNQQLDISLIN